MKKTWDMARRNLILCLDLLKEELSNKELEEGVEVRITFNRDYSFKATTTKTQKFAYCKTTDRGYVCESTGRKYILDDTTAFMTKVDPCVDRVMLQIVENGGPCSFNVDLRAKEHHIIQFKVR